MIRPKRPLLAIAAFFALSSIAYGGTSCWTGTSGCWNTAGNWSCCVPGNTTDISFDDSAGGASCSTHNICLDPCQSRANTLTVDSQTQNYTFQFQNGILRPTSTTNINGNAVFNCGGKLTSSGATGKIYSIGSCAGDTGTLHITGACSNVNLGKLNVGVAGSGTFILDSAGASTLNQFEMALCDCSSAYAEIRCTTLTLVGCNTSIDVIKGCGTTGTLVVVNSTISLCADIDLGQLNGGCGSNGVAYATFDNSDINIGEDLIVGQNRGQATLNITGSSSCISVDAGLLIGRACVVSAYAKVTDCANITVNGNSPGNASIYGADCVPTTFIISDGATVTNNSGSNCASSNIPTGSCTIITIDGATHTGTSRLDLHAGAVLRGDGCFGDGTWSSPIRLNGGTFNDGTAAGDILVLSSSGSDAITQQGATDDFVINGAGTIKIGSNDLIDNSTSDIDIDLNGGVLDINGMTVGASAASVGNLTISNGSTIAFASGDTSQDVFIKSLVYDNAGADTLNISGWGTNYGNSNSGVGGRLLIDTLAANGYGWALGDNSGAGFDGINWGGGITKSMFIDNGDGFFEVVPFNAVPETSTWLSTASALALIAGQHLFRRRKCKRLHLK